MSLIDKCMLPNGIEIAHINKNETDFLFKEIFEDRIYLQKSLVLDRGAVVFDVGANIGIFSLYVFAHYQGSKVFAFEPIPEIFDVLKTNSKFFDWNVKLFNIAVSDSIGYKEFIYYPKSSLQSGCYSDPMEDRKFLKATALHHQKENGLSFSPILLDKLIDTKLERNVFICPSVTLSQIINTYQVEKIDLLKIDVERSEWDVIRGIESKDWGRIKQVVIEIDNKNNYKLISDVLIQNGFDVDKIYYKPLSETSICMLYAKK